MRLRPLSLSTLLITAIMVGCAAPTPQSEPTTEPTEVVDIPTMRQRPVLDSIIQADEWAEARDLEGEFEIQDGTPASGKYDFRMKIGRTAEGLHLAILLPDFPENPWNHGASTYSDCVDVFFTDDAPGISTPSFFVGMCAGVSGHSTTHPGYWSGSDWVIDDDEAPSSFNNGRPNAGTWAFGGIANGTMFWEAFLAKPQPDSARNGLRLDEGAVMRMSLLLMRIGGNEPGSQSPDARGQFYAPHDAFPGAGYNPDGQYDPTSWIRVRSA